MKQININEANQIRINMEIVQVIERTDQGSNLITKKLVIGSVGQKLDQEYLFVELKHDRSFGLTQVADCRFTKPQGYSEHNQSLSEALGYSNAWFATWSQIEGRRPAVLLDSKISPVVEAEPALEDGAD